MRLLLVPVLACLTGAGCLPNFTSVPTEACGNGRIESGEACDDGNILGGDGCTTLCTVELNWHCMGQPSSCTDDVDGDGSPMGEDCDDNDPNNFPGNPEPPNLCSGGTEDVCDDGFDQNCDGYDTPCVIDTDCDGSPDDQDCQPDDANIYPEATERCDNLLDDNCNGFINEDCGVCDLDGDGFQREDPAAGCPDLSYPLGQDVDCNDNDPGIFPGLADACEGQEGGHPACTARQLCDGVDNDCDGDIDEGCLSLQCDADQDGYPNPTPGCNATSGTTDCDDSDPGIYPGAPDLCGDGIEQNCDSDLPCVGDSDGDLYTSADDCDDSDPNVHPGAPEQCNGMDDDCDDLIDEGCAP